MENKQTEIDNVVAGFTAVVMGLITHYRGKRDALNQVPQFCEAVEREQARMDRKFEAMLNDLSFAGLEHELRNAQHRVNQYAEAEKARALAGNTVDFDTLASAIRESGQGLAKAVSKMDSRHQETAARSRWNDHRRAWDSARVVVCGSHSATTSKMKLSA